MTEFKVMAYNLMDGFHNKVRNKRTGRNELTSLNQRRLDAGRRVVASENPDLLSLSEASFCDLARYPEGMDYKQLFNYPHGFGTCYEGSNGNMILSRHPFKAQEALPVGHSILSPKEKRNFLWAQIDLEGKLVSLIGAYPAHGRERDKLGDWEKVFDYDMVKNAERLIIPGDLNVFSDKDRYHRNLLSVCCRFIIHDVPEFDGRSPADVVDDFLSRETIPYLKSQGLDDTYTLNGERGSTMPTDAIIKSRWLKPLKLFKPLFAVRVDYILATPNLKVKEAYVVKSPDAEIAADHYPAVTVFDI